MLFIFRKSFDKNPEKIGKNYCIQFSSILLITLFFRKFSLFSDKRSESLIFFGWKKQIIDIKSNEFLLGWIDVEFNNESVSTYKETIRFMFTKLFIQNYKIMKYYLLENGNEKSKLIQQFQHIYIFAKVKCCKEKSWYHNNEW